MTPDSAANARLCRWLGIAPDSIYEGPHGKSHDRQYEYPDLATREGFWVMRDALEKRHEQFQSGFNGSWHWAIVGPESAFTQEGEEPNVGVLARGEGEPAALFEAAVALMDREGL